MLAPLFCERGFHGREAILADIYGSCPSDRTGRRRAIAARRNTGAEEVESLRTNPLPDGVKLKIGERHGGQLGPSFHAVRREIEHQQDRPHDSVCSETNAQHAGSPKDNAPSTAATGSYDGKR